MNRTKVTKLGSTLVIVTGISAMLLAMGVVFMIRMRTDAQSVKTITKIAQARIMLYAACNYIQETSRIGWMAESYGWVDIRNGTAGPKSWNRTDPMPLSTNAFPAQGGTAARCDMFVMTRPPWAVRTTYAYNPLPEQSNYDSGGAFQPTTGESTTDCSRYARFSYADPQAASTTWEDFANGDRKPMINSEYMSWFRVWRESDSERNGDGIPYYDTTVLSNNPKDIAWDGSSAPRLATPRYLPSTFIVTCGAGGTQGYRHYEDAPQGTFPGKDYFNAMRSDEVINWFRIEWSPNVNPGFMLSTTREVSNPGNENHIWQWTTSSLIQPPAGLGLGSSWPSNAGMTSLKCMKSFSRNFIGTIKWIQRLDREPPEW